MSSSQDINVRLFDAFVDRGFWLFAAFYVTYLNRYGRELEYEMSEDEEENVDRVVEHLGTLTLDDVELLLIDSIHLTNALQQEEEVVQRLMESMQQRIDEGENIMNICKYHIYYVIGSSRLLTVSLCKSIMPFLPVRVQSQDPRLLYTSLIHGYHVTHLLERASYHKPTLLLMQIEHNGNYIGLYREDRWSRRRDAHGIPDTILFSIMFYTRKGEPFTVIKKWNGRMSDEFIDGVEKPTKYVYVRSPDHYLMIGAGGKKGISFYASEDYTKAYSQKSDVFLNPPLCDLEFFSISNVELFDFVSPGMSSLHVCYQKRYRRKTG